MANNLSDASAQDAFLWWRMHVEDGRAERLRIKGRLDVGRLAKLCGCTPELVRAWERGLVQPTPAQTRTWLTALYSHATAPGADMARVSAAVSARGPLVPSAADPGTGDE